MTALRWLFGTALAALTLSGGLLASASAQDAPAIDPSTQPIEAKPIRAVVELFTSQGCSSCPPADELLAKLDKDPSIVALSFPVDYWDYLGWKDTFATARNTERQRGYAKARGDGAIYTPQVVVNGVAHVNGAIESDISSAIDVTANDARQPRVPIRFWQERNTLNIAVGDSADGKLVKDATIWLGVVQQTGSVDIKGGENGGRRITYTNIVRDMAAIGLWKGQALKIQIPRGAIMMPETQKTVVLIQEGRAGPILGAAWASLF
jgi:hypothetical protein